MHRRLLAAVVAAVLAWPASAGYEGVAPFYYHTDRPGTLFLDGPIVPETAGRFMAMLLALPETKKLVLNSDGGDVGASLVIADEVFKRGMATDIPEGAICASACAWIFMAGRERRVAGLLGVHQLRSEVESNRNTQYHLANVIEAMSRYGVPGEVAAIMMRTPPDSMYFFTPSEVALYGLTKSREAPKAAANQPKTKRSLIDAMLFPGQ